MADSKLFNAPALAALAAWNIADRMYIVDVSEPLMANQSKHITLLNLMSGTAFFDGINPAGGTLTINGNLVVEGTQIIDDTDLEAFLVRKDGDTGDVVIIDTVNTRLGIGGTPSYPFHVRHTSSGASALGPANDLVLESDGATGMSILSPDASNCNFYFGSVSDGLGAYHQWNFTNDEFKMGVGTATGSIGVYVDTNTRVLWITSNERLGVGVSPSAKLHVLSTTEQVRIAYDANNYFSKTVASNGITTFDITTATKAHFAFSAGITVLRSSTAASVNSARETIIGVTSTAAPRTITLDTDDVIDGNIIIVKDESGGAGANNITVDTEGAETIDGAASITISVNYGVARLYSDGSNWFSF